MAILALMLWLDRYPYAYCSFLYEAMERGTLLTLVGPFINSCGADVTLRLALLRIHHQDVHMLLQRLPSKYRMDRLFSSFRLQKSSAFTWFDA